ncbi:NAD(P)-dependent dehydrogenase (short-subunit alcohol dehydrogenase family) [Sphingobium sp. OAS761]|uniref:SDR family NAD(P)-dependent oxidoreductase n=1 Tax=Sphingobium sp. OAS761 TaxID=2817901 RepID=UPI00209C97FD|nr:SDR family NAD(P)-dependent oxidoreductase [Sphingobium sp. OAS761]MCP1471766.1 NAD(P)-dependent dehydrogenase (short-subunit alcohol dehydrogenase family) [Sphingobium sp. OAS761]
MTEMRFDDRVAIVTGAGGGLGKAYATLLAARGAKVLVNDLGGSFQGEGRDAGYAQAAAQEIRDAGGIAEANGDTVATAEGARAIVADAMHRWGRVDILVNNAGIVSASGTVSTVTDEQWTNDMAVSAGGTFYLCRAVWDGMLQRDYGRIVNISSGSWFGMGSAVPYPAAKGAVWAMTRGLASATRASGRNVRINAVMPIAGSRMTQLMGPEIHGLMERDFPARAVAPVVAMLAHEDAPCNGEMFTAGGGGYTRVFAGVTRGYRAADKDWTPEAALGQFDTVMDTTGFHIPEGSMDEAALYQSEVPWSAFKAFIQ